MRPRAPQKAFLQLTRSEALVLGGLLAMVFGAAGVFVGRGIGAGPGARVPRDLPLDEKTLLGMAQEAWARHDYEEAVRIYEWTAGHHPQCYDAHLFAGGYYLNYAKPVDWKAAQGHFEQATQIKRDAQAIRCLADSLVGQGLTARAEALFKESIDSNPAYQDAFYNYGVMLQNAKRWKEAMAMYNRLLKVNPKHEGAVRNRIECQKVLGPDAHSK